MTPQSLTTIAPPRSMDALLTKAWARLLVPSLSDLYFLAVLVWLFIAGSAGWKGLLADADAGWHIRTGEYILDHRAVPHADLYSWSRPDAPWYAWEWLTDVLFGLLHRGGGLKAVVLLSGVVITLVATILMRRIVWRGANVFVTLAVGLLGVGAMSIHFLARPHIFTLLLLSVSLWMLEADRRRPSQRIWLLVPLTALWTNLHGGFLALVACLGLLAAGSAVEAWIGGSGWRSPLRYLSLTAACAGASLLNPYGLNLHVHILAYLRSDWIRNWIQEFQSPSFRNENLMQFEALLLVGLIVAGSLLRRRQVAEALWILTFAHLALGSVRHVPIFVTVALPIIAGEITSWWNHWTQEASRGSLLGILRQMGDEVVAGFRRSTFWPAAVILALVFIGAPLHWPADFPDETLPVAMMRRHAAELAEGRVLAPDQWGDYLIYLNYPRQRVFVDGRSDFYGPEIGNQYIRLMQGGWDCQQMVERLRFDRALIPVEWPLASMLKNHPGWRIQEDDGKAILLVRNASPVLKAQSITPEPRFYGASSETPAPVPNENHPNRRTLSGSKQ